MISVNGVALNNAVRIEYMLTERYEDWDANDTSKRKSVEQGKTYNLEGYENLYSFGPPSGWELGGQFNYSLRNRLILRFPRDEQAGKN